MGDAVVGVDGCTKGWVGIVLTAGRVEGLFAPTIGKLEVAARKLGEVAVMAIDIPIGLPDAGVRQADVLARRRVGRRWPSVFFTPARTALESDAYEVAAQVNRELTGAGMTKQAFALRAKICEVEAWLPSAGCRVVEVHPEVSFAELAQSPLPSPKSTWAGVELRRSLLETANIRLPSGLGSAGATAGVDDVLDAAIAAWTAARVRDGLAGSLPDPPEVFRDGLAAAIWC